MELANQSFKALGTTIEIKLPSINSRLFQLCFDEISRIEEAYSRFKDSSELSKLNRGLGKWQSASDEMLFLLSKSADFFSKTDGNFDITLKSDLDLLGYDKDYSFKQKKHGEAAAGLQAKSNSAPKMVIDSDASKVLLSKEIDFGGFGKGYALDCVSHLLEQKGVFHYYINAGGDIKSRKSNQGDPWTIILEHPDDPEMAIGTIDLDGAALAASAPNRRKWGVGLHHLLNAKTHLPATGAKAIFLVAKTGIEADAYATALFTAGFEEAISLSKTLPVEMLIVSSQNKMYQSDGFRANIFK
ncbi:FAD:protein FMN transferase [Candidatus Micrarchaeota archaeon]|nr:FAD:protein FMN transferase [Candidatus Micrarchaeota archaeon]